MKAAFKHRSLIILATAGLISACAPGPSSVKQVAAQGLLSGELSPEGDAAVIGSIHHGGSFWNAKKKERLYDWNHKAQAYSSITASSISGDGKRAVTCENDALVLWETSEGKSLKFWQANAKISSIKLNHDGTRALMGLKDGTVSYFDLDRGSQVFSFKHEAEVRSVDLNADSSVGISGGDDNIAKVWDLKTGKEIRSVTLENQIKTVGLSDSGKLAFTTAQREDTMVWKVSNGKASFKFPNRYVNYTSIDFSDNEKYLVAGTFQGEIYKWNIRSGKEINMWKAQPRKPWGGAASKAIIDVIDQKSKVIALTSDGMLEVFKR